MLTCLKFYIIWLQRGWGILKFPGSSPSSPLCRDQKKAIATHFPRVVFACHTFREEVSFLSRRVSFIAKWIVCSTSRAPLFANMVCATPVKSMYFLIRWCVTSFQQNNCSLAFLQSCCQTLGTKHIHWQRNRKCFEELWSIVMGDCGVSLFDSLLYLGCFITIFLVTSLYRRLLSLIYQLIDLCHRKQKKMTGQFKGLVRATKRGAANVKQKKGKRWHKIHATPWAVKCLWGCLVNGWIIERDTFGKYPFYSLCSWRTILEIFPNCPFIYDFNS